MGTFYQLENAPKLEIIRFYMDLGLIAEEVACKKCGRPMKLTKIAGTSIDGYQWLCRVSRRDDTHTTKKSIRCGSWFSGSKLPLTTVSKITYLWVIKAEPVAIICQTGVNKNTVTDWLQFCRDVCVEICSRTNETIGGPGTIVEIDEAKFGRRKYNRGRRVEGHWVFGGVERGSRKSFFKIVENRSKDVLLGIIKEFILPGTTIVSDCWRAYDCLSDEGYIHLRVNHSYNFRDPDTGAHTNSIEGTWSAIRRGLRATRSAEDQFDSFLAEYMWRRKHGHLKRHDLYNAFIRDVKEIHTPGVEDE